MADIMKCMWSQTINDLTMRIDKIRYDKPNKLLYVSVDCRNYNFTFQIKAHKECTDLSAIETNIYFNEFTILNLLISQLLPD